MLDILQKANAKNLKILCH